MSVYDDDDDARDTASHVADNDDDDDEQQQRAYDDDDDDEDSMSASGGDAYSGGGNSSRTTMSTTARGYNNNNDVNDSGDDDDDAPPAKPAVHSFVMPLPHKSTHETTVHVRLSPWRVSFAQAYAAKLRRARQRRHKAQGDEQHDDDDNDEAAAASDVVDDVDDDNDEGATQQQPPPPYWLPHLLADDAYHLQRTLGVMYGWAVAPPPVATTHAATTASDNNNNNNNKSDMAALPRFPYTSYVFYIAYDRRSRQWHLLDLHPRVYAQQQQQQPPRHGQPSQHRRARKHESQRKQDDDNDGDDDDDDDNDASGSSSSSSVHDESNNASDDDNSDDDEDGATMRSDDNDEEADEVSTPHYDAHRVYVVDVLMLAAVQSAAALRCCLLQPCAAHLTSVQRWLTTDGNAHAGMWLLRRIAHALATARTRDASALPYRVPDAQLDYNALLQLRDADEHGRGGVVYASALATRSYGIDGMSCSNSGNSSGSSYAASATLVDDMARPLHRLVPHTHRWLCDLVRTLLRARIVPARPLQLHDTHMLDDVLLFLWLLLMLPRDLVARWGMAQQQQQQDEAQEHEQQQQAGDERTVYSHDDDNDDGHDGSDNDYDQQQQQELQTGVTTRPLLPAPLLLYTLMEVRRRLARERHARAPSQLPLLRVVSPYCTDGGLEDGRRDGVDPLVCADVTLTRARTTWPRPQRLYQSDMVLLLLALTTTPTPRSNSNSNNNNKNNNSNSEAAAAMVQVRRRSRDDDDIASSADAHLPLFATLLQRKLQHRRTALQHTRAGMWRALLCALPRVAQPATVALLCDAAPLYALLGPCDACPLSLLLHAWAVVLCPATTTATAAATAATVTSALTATTTPAAAASTAFAPQQQRYLDVFVRTFWHELHERLVVHRELAAMTSATATATSTSTHAATSRLLSLLLDKTHACVARMDECLQQLSGPLHRHSRVHGSGVAVAADIVVDDDKTNTHTRTTSPCVTRVAANNNDDDNDSATVTLLRPDPYADELLREEARVATLFAALPMAPRSYLTSTTLHALLFDAAVMDVVAVRHVMLYGGVATVRRDALTQHAVPALEYAIRTRHAAAAQLLVGLGCTLDSAVEDGGCTLDRLAEMHLDVAAVARLRRTCRANAHTRAVNARSQYGLLDGVCRV